MDLNAFLKQLERAGEENDRFAQTRSEKYLNITPDTGEFLCLMVKALAAKNILEVGTSNGYSTLWLASAMTPSGKVTTIEQNPEKVRMARDHFQMTGFESRIDILEGDAISKLSELETSFDLIFLDAERSQYMTMWPDLERLLRRGGVIVVDNAISHKEELIEFMDALREQENLTCSLLPIGKGEFVVHKA